MSRPNGEVGKYGNLEFKKFLSGFKNFDDQVRLDSLNTVVLKTLILQLRIKSLPVKIDLRCIFIQYINVYHNKPKLLDTLGHKIMQQ